MWAPYASAASIRVAQDGSGDYTSVFDGLAAAQDGDTVSIGPGEYTETRWLNPSGQYAFRAMGYVAASNVVVVGDDRDSVILGPAIPPAGLSSTGEAGLVAGLGASGVSFSQLTLRNLSRALIDADQAMTVEGCRFDGNYYGIDQNGLGACSVSGSAFEGNRRGVIAFSAHGSRGLEIIDCKFSGNEEAIQIQNPDTLVRDCSMSGGDRGVMLALGGNAIVQGCVISDTARRGVHVSDGSTVWLYNNVLQGQMQYNLYTSGGAIVGGGNLLSGGTVETIHLGDPGYIEFFGNHILNGGGLTVLAGTAPWTPRTVSIANNWWGTTDPAQIEEWIEHAPDDPENNGLTIEYLPFYGGPVPNKASSMGRLKATFSDQ